MNLKDSLNNAQGREKAKIGQGQLQVHRYSHLHPQQQLPYNNHLLLICEVSSRRGCRYQVGMAPMGSPSSLNIELMTISILPHWGHRSHHLWDINCSRHQQPWMYHISQTSIAKTHLSTSSQPVSHFYHSRTSKNEKVITTNNQNGSFLGGSTTPSLTASVGASASTNTTKTNRGSLLQTQLQQKSQNS